MNAPTHAVLTIDGDELKLARLRILVTEASELVSIQRQLQRLEDETGYFTGDETDFVGRQLEVSMDQLKKVLES